jgi:lysozyme family protein
MRENFNKAFDLLIELEGYQSDDKNDKGGLTRYGIAQKYHPEVDVLKLTKEQAKEIYLKDYWINAGCDEQDYPCDVVLFIQGVNIGVAKAKTFMEQSKGLLDFFMLCLNHYTTRGISYRNLYLAGWCNRLIKLWRAI